MPLNFEWVWVQQFSNFRQKMFLKGGVCFIYSFFPAKSQITLDLTVSYIIEIFHDDLFGCKAAKLHGP